jgi:alpha-L-fucosidase
MSRIKFTILVLLFPFLYGTSYAQNKDLTWEELREIYEFPAWYTEARFGIWTHWGAQSEPLLGGGWYARHMYQKDVGGQTFGKNAYSYHNKTYGHPSEKGFKDVIHEWKAEKLDTDALMKYFKSIGAKYFVAMANHHDHFDNFNSTHHSWNSVNIGPKKDIIAEFKNSAKKYGLPFGVSSHDDRHLSWWQTAFGADTEGPKKGIPYDGHMTKKDGIGKWWEGLDPADLYGLPPEKRTPEWIEGMKENWMLRHKELAIKYDVDFLWFDGYGFPYGEYGKEVCKAYFNHRLNKKGKVEAVIAGKFTNEPSTVKDIERGGANEILPYPWQSITTFTHWFYKEDEPPRHSARTVIEMMSDVISKNGNFLLNVELRGDGTIPEEHKIILDELGAWVNLNEEAIYESKPWKVYGDNLFSYLKRKEGAATITDLEALKKQAQSEQFNERTIESEPYGNDEVRFTTRKGKLYIFVLNPKSGKIELPALGLKSPEKPNKIKSVKLIGSKNKIEFEQDDDKLTFTVPENRPNKYTSVFEVKGVL